ncbi:YLP motif-containing protein 1-like [Rhagoletis pomonella]|uniref:YLP motif-containing protein 1-like n=1 Tax=Rhagoletis pomonella TaxID=28610 RepID=UPI0017861B80|nr:YLP motif-containing protein 1-like [Rhagoletis pomonella]
MADVSHLTNHYIPPKTMMPSSTARATMMQPSDRLPNTRMKERIVTTIEKQELRELPTQTEYLQPGQQPYGIGAASSSSSNNQGGGMPARGHSGELPLEMMIPRELLSPPPPPPPPRSQEEQPIVAPATQYLAPMESTESTNQRQQNSMPMRQYLAPPMTSSDEPQQMNSITADSNHHFAPDVNAHDQQETLQDTSAPSRQYLSPMSMSIQEHESREASMAMPNNQYLAPAPTMPSSGQQLQQQSAPAVHYLPPQQQMLEMPPRQYLAPQIQRHEMQMHQQMEPEQRSQAMPASSYLPPTSNMSPPTLEMSSPSMEVVPQMEPTREYLSPFGEAENVAEAAQESAKEATAMFEEQSAHQPTPPALAEEPASYYLPPQSPAAQQLNYQQQYQASQPTPQPEQMPPVEFVLRHHQLMTQPGSVDDDAPVFFAQFQSMSSAASPTAQTAAEPMPAHFLSDDGYHYRNGGSGEGLSNANLDVRRFRVRH